MSRVLIPFISGLDCYAAAPAKPNRGRSLNPFYFRAGLLPTTLTSCSKAIAVLIPFISGLDCYSDYVASIGGTICLNPFYFRAGLLRAGIARKRGLNRLNPFYFRAGLLRGTSMHRAFA